MNVAPRSFTAEISRKSLHLLTGLVPLIYALGMSRDRVILVLALMCLGMLAIERLRRTHHRFARIFQAAFGRMLRSFETTKFLGATHYCFASLICVAGFDRHLAVLALLYLALGDTAASLVGLAFGSLRVGRKSLEGFLAFWLACSLTALIAWIAQPAYPLEPALLAALLAGLVELLLDPRINDNLAIPLTAVLTMWLVGLA